eukprot:TRINITY_DN28289_c0_g1_i1.p1 TRINITY_DN28289_c0_g1~~TRINITY_DN28289_c0_g1_i1.p1  ORF type:complete len:525 (+),score=159.75 TRINITY_DN28289_c0_g1_i1:79-1575(+)
MSGQVTWSIPPNFQALGEKLGFIYFAKKVMTDESIDAVCTQLLGNAATEEDKLQLKEMARANRIQPREPGTDFRGFRLQQTRSQWYFILSVHAAHDPRGWNPLGTPPPGWTSGPLCGQQERYLSRGARAKLLLEHAIRLREQRCMETADWRRRNDPKLQRDAYLFIGEPLCIEASSAVTYYVWAGVLERMYNLPAQQGHWSFVGDRGEVARMLCNARCATELLDPVRHPGAHALARAFSSVPAMELGRGAGGRGLVPLLQCYPAADYGGQVARNLAKSNRSAVLSDYVSAVRMLHPQHYRDIDGVQVPSGFAQLEEAQQVVKKLTDYGGRVPNAGEELNNLQLLVHWLYALAVQTHLVEECVSAPLSALNQRTCAAKAAAQEAAQEAEEAAWEEWRGTLRLREKGELQGEAARLAAVRNWAVGEADAAIRRVMAVFVKDLSKAEEFKGYLSTTIGVAQMLTNAFGVPFDQSAFPPGIVECVKMMPFEAGGPEDLGQLP